MDVTTLPLVLSSEEDLGPNARLLEVYAPPNRRSVVFLLTVGHERAVLDAAAAQADGASTLPSPFASLVTSNSSLSLPAPWRTHCTNTQTRTADPEAYKAKLCPLSGVQGTANGANSSLVRHVVRSDIVSPLLLQSADAIGWGGGNQMPLPGVVGTLTRELVSSAAACLDPALARPLGGGLPDPSHQATIYLDKLPGPALPTPLAPAYFGSDRTKGCKLFWEASEVAWTNEFELGNHFSSGPELLATHLIQAHLDAEYQQGPLPGTGRASARWVAKGSWSLPDGGIQPGQPDFAFEYRANERSAWKVLVTGEIKIFVASPLLIELLRRLHSDGDVVQLSDQDRPDRPAWDRLVTQMTLEMLAAGANCAILWTGIDWVVVDREQGADGKVELRVWPKLLRSRAMLGHVTEYGVPLDPGQTRHGASSHFPKPEEEECELSEAGFLAAVGLRAIERLATRPFLPLPRETMYKLTKRQAEPSAEGRQTKARHSAPSGRRLAQANIIVQGDIFGSGSVATTHRARIMESGTDTAAEPRADLVAKLARDVAPASEAFAWPKTRRGRYSFAAAARELLSIEAEAYDEAERLQGSVLPRLEGVFAAPRELYEGGEGSQHDESGELVASTSISSSEASVQTPRDSLILAQPQADDAKSPQLGLGMTSVQPSTTATPAPTLSWPPPFLDGIVLTLAGRSLRSLLGDDGAADAGKGGQGGRGGALRQLLSEADGIDDAPAAVSWLQGALAEALGALHSCDVAHGDVREGNVCLDRTPLTAALKDSSASFSKTSEATTTPDNGVRLRLIDLTHAILARDVSAAEFAEAKARDLAQGREMVERVVARAWGGEASNPAEEDAGENDSDGETESSTSDGATPMPSPPSA